MVAPKGTYTWWTQAQTPAGGFFNLDSPIYISLEPATKTHGVFYSHQFSLIGGDGGYVGLQKDPGGRKKAIFSIWQALAASSTGVAQPFSGEGTGYQRLIDYPWAVGHYYRARVWVVSADATGTWWVGAIIDETHTEQQVGMIKVPPQWKWLSGTSVNWVEYYANSTTLCSALGRSEVYFYPPSVNGTRSATATPQNIVNPGPCPSSIALVNGWQRHRNAF